MALDADDAPIDAVGRVPQDAEFLADLVVDPVLADPFAVRDVRHGRTMPPRNEGRAPGPEGDVADVLDVDDAQPGIPEPRLAAIERA